LADFGATAAALEWKGLAGLAREVSLLGVD
jgi:hypothetical protein